MTVLSWPFRLVLFLVEAAFPRAAGQASLIQAQADQLLSVRGAHDRDSAGGQGRHH